MSDRPSNEKPASHRTALIVILAAPALLLIAVGGVFGYNAIRGSTSALEAVPRLSHVFTIVLENESYAKTWGPGSPAHYLNSLRTQGELLTNYYGVGHNSNDNYIALTSGQVPTTVTMNDCVQYEACVQSDSRAAVDHGANIGTQLSAAGIRWKGYFEDMPSPCFHSPAKKGDEPYWGDSTSLPARNYASRHDPFVYYAPIVHNQKLCGEHVVPYTQLASDMSKGTVPRYAFIVPNTCDDGHDSPCSTGQPGGLPTADAWLKQNVPPIINYVNAQQWPARDYVR